MSKEMTRKERIIAALKHQETDRVPMDYWGVPEITEKLMTCLDAKNDIELADKLGIDKIMVVEPPLIVERKNMWDIPYIKVPLNDGSGFYDEPETFPIGEYETIDQIEEHYTWPTTSMYDYSVVPDLCEHYKDFALEGGYTSLTYYYELLRGTERMFLDFIENPALAKYIIGKISEFCFEHSKKILELGDGRITVTQMTDDLGAQKGLLMSEAMIDDFLREYYDKYIAMIKSFGSMVFHHNDGDMCKVMPWLIDRGIEILNPLQWHLPSWDLDFMKKTYGKEICFHGGIDNQYVLPFGTEREVIAEVEACIDSLYCDRTGYILAPCHNLQAITPVENIIAMYSHAKSYSEKRI